MIACRSDALRPSLRFFGGQPFREILDVMRQRPGTLGQLVRRLTRCALLRRCGLLRVRLRHLLALLLRLLRCLRLLRSLLVSLLACLLACVLARLLGRGLRGLLRPLLPCGLL